MKVNNIQTIAASVILCLPCASSSSINGPAFVPSLVLSSSSANKLMKNVNGVSKSKSSTLLNVLPKDEQQDASPSRRSFLKKLTTSTGIITSATTFGTIGNFDMGDHGIACDCDSCSQPTASATSLHALGCDCLACAGAQVEGGIGQTEGQVVFDDNYSSGCACPSCRRVPTHRYGPAPAMAYETMDEDGIKRSPDYYAQIIQMNETNARLSASGYKLDSREEENAKISDAFASFSYDAATSTASKSSQKGGSKKNTSKGKNDS